MPNLCFLVAFIEIYRGFKLNHTSNVLYFHQKVGGTKTSLNKQNNMKVFVIAFYHNFRIGCIMSKAKILFAAIDKVMFRQIFLINVSRLTPYFLNKDGW